LPVLCGYRKVQIATSQFQLGDKATQRLKLIVLDKMVMMKASLDLSVRKLMTVTPEILKPKTAGQLYLCSSSVIIKYKILENIKTLECGKTASTWEQQ